MKNTELLIKLYKEAIDSYQLLLQFTAQDISQVKLSDQITLTLYKWPDVVGSAIGYICKPDIKQFDQLIKDLNFIVLEPIKSFYMGLAEKVEDEVGGVPRLVKERLQAAKRLEVCDAKKEYVECINSLFDVLQAVTKNEYPRIGAQNDQNGS